MKNQKISYLLLLLLLLAPGAWAAPPVANPDSDTTAEDTPVTIDVLANDTDADGDTLSVDATFPLIANDGTVVNNGTDVTYTPDPDFFGVDTFDYRLTDGNGGQSVATVTVTVTAVNDPPVANDDSQTLDEDTVANFNVLVNDDDPVESDPVTMAGVNTLPANGTLVWAANGDVTYTPSTDYFGADSFTYQAADCVLPACLSNLATVTLTVDPVQDDPVAVDDAASTAEDTPVTTGDLTAMTRMWTATP